MSSLYRRGRSLAARMLGRGRRNVPKPGDPRFPDWRAILNRDRQLWDEARRRAAGGQTVLVGSTVGGYGAGSVFESMLSVALTLRGARVHTLICDRALPGCQRAEYTDVPDPSILVEYRLKDRLCDRCYATGQYHFEPLGLTNHRLTRLTTRAEKLEARRIAVETPVEKIRSFTWEGMAIGDHAYAGALRYFARGDLDAEPLGEQVLRRYLEASLLMASASARLIQREGIEIATFNHGLYVPQGVLGEVCRGLDVRVANWNPAYRTSCFIFSHGDTYHHTLMAEPTEAWETMPWTPAMEAQIQEYLKSRWSGTRDWIWFHDEPDEDFAAYARDVGLDLNRPIVALLTNVMWDAQLHYPANAFPSMLDWVLRTVEYFKSRPDLQLLIRVHPAEIRGTATSRQPLVPELSRAFPELPANVFVIPPESQVSTYAAVAGANAAIIYGTKTGVELTSVGIPTIVAGEAWIRNKGLTLDASSPADYFEILARLPLAERMPPEQVERARKYAYHFFFRRMVPVPCMIPTKAVPPFKVAIDTIEDLLPGRQPGLDVICDGILTGSPFIFPAEQYGVHDG
ncbi:MAG TPA: capsule biosynthesis protein [Chloroflexota bacterium]|nr:capsule biosynthesis protein [Chloroflexota bacterium]